MSISPMFYSLQHIRAHVIEGEALEAEEAVQEALSEGASAAEVQEQALIPAMDEIGARFQRQEIFLPEMVMAGGAMKAALGVLRPRLVQATVPSSGRVVVGTVEGDVHDIGKSLVAMMLEGAGFEVVDLGTNVSPGAFVRAVREHRASILGMSSLLTTTMRKMKPTIDALVAAGLRTSVKIMVGGAPLNASFADEIGADGYAYDASRAVTLAKSLMIPTSGSS